MNNFKYKIFFLSFLFLTSLIINCASAVDYNELIEKFFLNRKIDSIEGIWEKTYANQGPTGCVTMFYKDQGQYYQIHIDKCFVMGNITGKQKKISDIDYEGENAIYFYDRKVIWEPSTISISENLKNFSILHGSSNNKFTEKWKRIWPEDFKAYNNNFQNK